MTDTESDSSGMVRKARTQRSLTLAVTWSPCEKVSMGLQEQLNYYLEILKTFTKCAKSVAIFPELNQSAVLHFHMEVQVFNRKEWMKLMLRMKEEGFIKVKDNVDANWWIYLNKDRKIMEELLQRKLPITLDELRSREPSIKLKSDILLAKDILSKFKDNDLNLCDDCYCELTTYVKFE